jgi:hypothetical protein
MTEDKTKWMEDEESEGATGAGQAGGPNEQVTNGQIGIRAIIKTVNTNHKGTVITLAGCMFTEPEDCLILEDLVRYKEEVIVTIRPREPKML